MVYRFIDKYKFEFGLRWLFRQFKLSPNAYYNYLKNRKAAYKAEKSKVKEAIKSIYYNNGRIIGHRWMVIFLARQNIFISKTTAHKYMNKELNLYAITMKKKPKYIKREAITMTNSKWINSDLAIKTLSKAIEREKPEKGLILHLDQEVQLTSWTFVKYCENHGIKQSMSKTGCPYDNAPIERFYKSFKTELIYLNKFETDVQLGDAVNR